MTSPRARLSVWKFTSCDGCQLTLLDCEDELIALSEQIEIAYFLEASSAALPGPYDLAVVEGSITTPAEEERIRQIRRDARLLVTIGACATAGGIQALRNGADVDEFIGIVYPDPSHIETLATSTPISDHVPVDVELRGCPIDKGQLLDTITSLVAGRAPSVRSHSVCLECKRAGVPCLLVTRDEPCLGPVTHAGCNALCPRLGRGCFGCFGPAETARTVTLGAEIRRRGHDPAHTRDLLSTFGVAAFAAEEP